jgi:glycosyltransferase involved in cell wall biosynthesis
MPEMPAVSVVIPAYNAEAYLGPAIESILAQTLQDFEIVVIDDCSRDRTGAVIEQYASKDARIRAFRNESNLGIAGNRNRGVQLARGKYIVWQDADDISLPTRLERQFHFMEAHPEVGIVGGYIELFRGSLVLGVREYPVDDEALRRCIFRYSPIAQPAAMVRAEALRAAGEYDRRYPPAEDIDMTFRIGSLYRLANVPEIVVRYRESDTSATFTRLRKMELSSLEIRWRHRRLRGYRMSAGDALYNLAHWVSVWTVPPRTKIRLFNWWRNSRAS